VAGLSTNLYVDLKPQLGSDLQKNVFNYYSYQNPVVDSLIEAASARLDLSEAGPIFKQIQAIVHEDQPATYLFWFDNIVGVNDRVQGTSVDIFSAYHNFWNWYVRPAPR
jgi:peptide/nickel transport system substrate-binding protein